MASAGDSPNRPVVLGPNQPTQFYRGAAAIAEFRGRPDSGVDGMVNGVVDARPEDWVASTTTRFGEPMAGLSRLPDGRLLRDAVRADPVGFLGPDHVDGFGADPGLLVKLLDAGQRLPVHVHPDRAFAARHLGCRYGKTEAWIVLGTRTPEPLVYLGLREDTDVGTLADQVRAQDTEALLDALHPLRVAAGDTVLVPAGTPHAIGAGVFVLELQEPTDLSVLLEWQGFEDQPSYLGMDANVALGCVDRTGMSADRLAVLRSGRPETAPGSTPLFPTEAEPFFRADLVSAAGPDPVRLDAGFGVLVVTAGAGRLVGAGGEVPVRRGSTVLLPWAAGPVEVHADEPLRAYRCRPPTTPPPSRSTD